MILEGEVTDNTVTVRNNVEGIVGDRAAFQ